MHAENPYELAQLAAKRMNKIHITSLTDLFGYTDPLVLRASREFFILPEVEFDIAHDEFRRWCVAHALGLVLHASIRGHDKTIQTFLHAWRTIEITYIEIFNAYVFDRHVQAYHNLRIQVIVTDNSLIIAG